MDKERDEKTTKIYVMIKKKKEFQQKISIREISCLHFRSLKYSASEIDSQIFANKILTIFRRGLSCVTCVAENANPFEIFCAHIRERDMGRLYIRRKREIERWWDVVGTNLSKRRQTGYVNVRLRRLNCTRWYRIPVLSPASVAQSTDTYSRKRRTHT